MGKTENGKLTNILNTIYDIDYPLTASEKSIAQKDRNEIKYNLLAKIVEILKDEGMEDIHRTEDGYIVELQNRELGMIPVQIDIKVKDLDYDLDAAIESWEIKVNERLEKERLQAEVAAKKAEKRKKVEEIRKKRNQSE